MHSDLHLSSSHLLKAGFGNALIYESMTYFYARYHMQETVLQQQGSFNTFKYDFKLIVIVHDCTFDNH